MVGKQGECSSTGYEQEVLCCIDGIINDSEMSYTGLIDEGQGDIIAYKLREAKRPMNCKNLATIKRYWPGNPPDLICLEHAQDSKRIAEAMGFVLILEPIGYPAGEIPTCCCSEGFSQVQHEG